MHGRFRFDSYGTVPAGKTVHFPGLDVMVGVVSDTQEILVLSGLYMCLFTY